MFFQQEASKVTPFSIPLGGPMTEPTPTLLPDFESPRMADQDEDVRHAADVEDFMRKCKSHADDVLLIPAEVTKF